jgi:hypothetical protein
MKPSFKARPSDISLCASQHGLDLELELSAADGE